MTFERKNIQKMQGYASGEQPEDPSTIKLNTNENPFSPSKAVANVLQTFDPASLRRYPPATAEAFRRAAADLHDVSPSNIIATRGGDELLRLVITTFVEPGETIGMSDPTYSLYPVLAQIQDCPILKVPVNKDWSLPSDFAESMNQAKVKLTFVVNPHAPSGTLLPFERLSELANELDSLLLLDEAYIDFVEPDSFSQKYQTVKLITEHPNIIILRTLSKGYSLAGLRFGYGIADASLIEPMMTKTRDSYNLDAISQQIAVAALTDQAYASSRWAEVISEREKMRDSLTKLGFHSPVSHANFLLATVPLSSGYCAQALYEKLKEKRILVRFFNTKGMDDKLRISIGNASENATLINELTTLIV